MSEISDRAQIYLETKTLLFPEGPKTFYNTDDSDDTDDRTESHDTDDREKSENTASTESF